LVDGERLKDIKKLPGYRPLAIDVATIVEVIRERWAVVQGKTPFSLADLDRYPAQALDLLAGVGLKEQAPATTRAAALTRQRAFTLFERGYHEARRAVLYLRACHRATNRRATRLQRPARKARTASRPFALTTPPAYPRHCHSRALRQLRKEQLNLKSMSRARSMYLGVAAPPSGGDMAALHVPVHHFVTHACVLGMTGSGKTGMVEEALRSGCLAS
jgi:hypothetical protein